MTCDGFQDRPHKPLAHPSTSTQNNTQHDSPLRYTREESVGSRRLGLTRRPAADSRASLYCLKKAA